MNILHDIVLWWITCHCVTRGVISLDFFEDNSTFTQPETRPNQSDVTRTESLEVVLTTVTPPSKGDAQHPTQKLPVSSDNGNENDSVENVDHSPNSFGNRSKTPGTRKVNTTSEDRETRVIVTGWGPWTQWTQCLVKCGTGYISRSRNCTDSDLCTPGGDLQNKTCEAVCAVWGAWESWGRCGITCGPGIQRRIRRCYGDGVCHGVKSQGRLCHISKCPAWDSWKAWSGCSSSCGQGVQRRKRMCSGDGCSSNYEDYVQTKRCNLGLCSVWSAWSPWTACPGTCGSGRRERSRYCVGLGRCSGPYTDNRDCQLPKCPVSDMWTPWMDWSSCSQSCGVGYRFRYRRCTSDLCPGPNVQYVNCEEEPCAGWKPWSSWGTCTTTCDQGWQRKTRECVDEMRCVGHDSEHRICNIKSCSGLWSEWGQWGRCSVTCESGMQYRTRRCIVHPCRGTFWEGQTCNVHVCPVRTSNIQCGRGHSSIFLIIGGQEADDGEWPWQVGIVASNNGENSTYCGGSLITDQFVLTAAHCLYRKKSALSKDMRKMESAEMHILAGDNRRNHGIIYHIEQSEHHHGFSFDTYWADLALLKLSEPVELSSKIRPICLPKEPPKIGNVCYVVGWGRTTVDNNSPFSEHLKEVKQKIHKDGGCEVAWQNSDITYRSGMFCAGEYPRKQNSHRGDSGGAFACAKDGRYHVQGVVSVGVLGSWIPSIYADVYYFKSWIESTMRQMSS